SVLATIADGQSVITETIYENRLKHLEEFKKMGAVVEVKGNKAYFTGVEALHGADVYATDLRAGAALVVAGLVADGVTNVNDIMHIDRGYENIDEKFRLLGADIERVID
ncbi:MAG: UDP-N-acetylglucosamine 1-carboxyvinyltransferase, partial [Clostridia bacterium]|nr:UDP-N-acetylglucosamine 1-carboxyvinyltransferase [Clostridia bacterium]